MIQFSKWKLESKGSSSNTSFFPGFSASKESAGNVGDLSSIPGLGRSPGGAHGNPLQCSCLENPHEQSTLVGYSPWGLKELDMSEQLRSAHIFCTIRLTKP